MSNFQELVTGLLQSRIEAGAMSAAAVRIEQRGEVLLDWAGGRRDFSLGAPAASTDSIFHVASISKPMSTSGVVKLIERGLIDLDDPVAKHVPEFAGHGKEQVTLRHCLTHTSGLPDMVPGNIELRKRNAPIGEFVAAACRARLLFRPGSDVRYQSSGILMLGEVAERVTGVRFRDYLAAEVFGPAGMTSTHLGWREEYAERNVAAKVRDPETTAHWNHNSAYWRDFGGPWAGVHTNTADITRLLRVMLNGGKSDSGVTVFKPGTVRILTQDHTAALPDLQPAARLREAWGLGWRIQRAGNGGWYGSAVPPGAFGHAGATGTVAWADRTSKVIFVLLTNGLQDLEGGTLKACGNITAATLCG